jgi:xanthine dehydrogenase YagS FAD-binding subunit
MTSIRNGELRAGGTDLSERRRSGRSGGPVVDIADLTGLTGLTEIAPTMGGGVRLGALVTVERVARELAAYPALAATAAALATPEIRTVATIGGNLLQHTRCAYYRNPAVDCLRSGGTGCPARDGLAHHGVADDRGPCVAPHPSSIGMALLAYDATVEVAGGPARGMESVFGDGTAHHGLGDGEILTAVVLPPPLVGERAAYERATSRRFAEWPLVEAVARIGVTDGRITTAAVGAGGVAPVPLRLRAVEALLIGERPETAVLAAAAEAATDGFRPLPQTAYKLPLLRATVLDVLARACEV